MTFTECQDMISVASGFIQLITADTSHAKMGLGPQKGTLDLLQIPRRHDDLPDLTAIAARHFPGAITPARRPQKKETWFP